MQAGEGERPACRVRPAPPHLRAAGEAGAPRAAPAPPQIAWTCFLSLTCGGPAAPLGIDGSSGNPVQCHGGLSPADVPGAGAHQVAALDALLGAWGVAGLPGQPEAALELLGNYVDLKTGLLRQACSMRTPGGL